MQKKWFKGCIKLEHVRKLFKELAMEHHPDRGGNTRIMQEIIAEYHEMLKGFEGTKLYNAKTKEEYSYRYSYKNEQAIADKLDQILKLKLFNIVIELVGSWIWVSGTSKEQANLFNNQGVGMKFTRNHGGKWYWSASSSFGVKHSSTGLKWDQIKNIHGKEDIDQPDAIKQTN